VAVPLKRIYERLFDFPNLNHASAIHYTATEEMERASFLKLRAPAVIVPNGIDWRRYAMLPSRGVFRNRIGIDFRTSLLLFLGRINFKKGLDLLVPSFAQVLEKIPNARLAIVGPDNEGYGVKVRQWCREQGIAEKVIFVDHLGLHDVIQAYVDADVFVLPSYTENFGMTVVEAMACGCPVVISDQVNIWREVQEEGAGLVVSLEPAQIADAICRVLEDKEAAREMGRRGRSAAERRYAWPQIVEQLTDIYRRLIAEKTAGRRRPKK
jgi:glycosyltransferase involved in cell wall biosynthesis